MLGFGLDALRGGRHAQALGKRDDGADDRHAFAHALGRALDEAAVDLDRREAGAAEIAERRIAGAEVVEAEPYAEVQDALQHLGRAEPLVHEHALGHFQFEAFGRQAGLRQRLGHGGDEIGILELIGRDVDRDADVAGPARRLLAGGAQYPGTDRADQPGLFGQRDELDRRDAAELRAVPAEQCLEAGELAGVRVDDGLVGEVHLALLERAAQRHLEHAALLGLGVELGLIGVEDAAADILRPVEREVGGADQHLRGAAVARADGEADRGADMERVLVDLVGARQRLDHAVRDALDVAGVGRIGDHHRELVATEATAGQAILHHLPQPLGDADEQPIADQMAERVVDRLEAVEVDQHECAAAAPMVRLAHRTGERLVDVEAIGEAGQRVEAREAADLVG